MRTSSRLPPDPRVTLLVASPVAPLTRRAWLVWLLASHAKPEPNQNPERDAASPPRTRDVTATTETARPTAAKAAEDRRTVREVPAVRGEALELAEAFDTWGRCPKRPCSANGCV